MHNDLGWPWTAISLNFRRISRDFADSGGNNSQTNEDSDRVVTYMFLVLICRGFHCQGPSYTHCCRTLTLALARLSCNYSCHSLRVSCWVRRLLTLLNYLHRFNGVEEALVDKYELRYYTIRQKSLTWT